MSQLEQIHEALSGLNDAELAEVSDFIAELVADGEEEEDEDDDDEENDVEIDEEDDEEEEDFR